MPTSSPIRIDQDVFESAKQAGEILSRSAAQQVNHWARIGREIESAPGLRVADITKVLAGEQPYSSLPGREQAVVRAAWQDNIAALRAGLNFEDEFTAAGSEWVEARPDGTVVRRSATTKRPSTGRRRSPR